MAAWCARETGQSSGIRTNQRELSTCKENVLWEKAGSSGLERSPSRENTSRMAGTAITSDAGHTGGEIVPSRTITTCGASP